MRTNILLKNKRFLSIGIILLLASTLTSCASPDSSNDKNDRNISFKTKPFEREKNVFHHAVPQHTVLIYSGGAHRPFQWDAEHFDPYLAGKVDGKEKWLFDGFLFLEILDGHGRGFASGYQKQAARKEEWEKLLSGYFKKGNGIAALNEQAKAVKERIGASKAGKRKIILVIPEPIPNQTDWGEINGKKMVFTDQTNRLSACKWYIDRAEQLFKDSQLTELELVGFYWLAEEATNTRHLVNQVSEYLDKKGYDFYWIPYFYADGYNEWQHLGFNVPYYQPNYFFDEKHPYSRLQETCDRAAKYGMNLEVEFDDRALASQKNWGYRLRDYLDVFEKNGAFNSLKIAYYQGNDTFYKLAKSDHPADQTLYKRLVKLIAK